MTDQITAFDVLERAVQHARSERSGQNFVVPGGVQFVSIPAGVDESLFAQVSSSPPATAGPVKSRVPSEPDHPRSPSDTRGELELCLRAPYAGGCNAAASRLTQESSLSAASGIEIVLREDLAAAQERIAKLEAEVKVRAITCSSETCAAREHLDKYITTLESRLTDHG